MLRNALMTSMLCGDIITGATFTTVTCDSSDSDACLMSRRNMLYVRALQSYCDIKCDANHYT